MSQEKKAAQPIEVTEEEAQQAIADRDRIFNDPEIARKFTQKLLALGGLEDEPSQERLERVAEEFQEKYGILLKIPDKKHSDHIEWVFKIIYFMIKALKTNPTVDGTAHTQLLKNLIEQLNDCTEIESSVQSCLGDALKLFSKYCDVDINTVLQQAIKSKSPATVQFLLDDGFKLFSQQRNEKIDTLLQKAIESDSLKVAKLLIKRGASIQRGSSLHPAIHDAPKDFIQWLLEERENITPALKSSPTELSRDKRDIVEAYIEKKYTPEMLDIEKNIEELRRSSENRAMKEALKPDRLLIDDIIGMVSSYIVRSGNETVKNKAVEDKAEEKRDTIQPIPDIRVQYIQWARQKLRELAELIPVETDEVIPAIEVVKDEVLKVLTSSFLRVQCETFWGDLKKARKENKQNKPLSGVLPPGTTSTVAEDKSLPQVSLVGNTATLKFSSSEGSHGVQGAPTNDNSATSSSPEDNSPKNSS